MARGNIPVSFFFLLLTSKLCDANGAQRSLRPHERLVSAYSLPFDGFGAGGGGGASVNGSLSLLGGGGGV